jgi:hypothetical protein
MKTVAVGRPQTLNSFPKPKLLRDRYLNINKGECPLGWAMALPSTSGKHDFLTRFNSRKSFKTLLNVCLRQTKETKAYITVISNFEVSVIFATSTVIPSCCFYCHGIVVSPLASNYT